MPLQRPLLRLALIAIAVAAVASSAIVLVDRSAALEGQGTAAIALDLDAAGRLCRQVGYDRDRFLAEAAAAGVTSLAVRGLTVPGLLAEGKAMLLTGDELADGLRLVELAPGVVPRADRSYLVVVDREIADRAAGPLARAFGSTGYLRLDVDGLVVFELAASVEELLDLHLGFDADAAQLALAHGFEPVFVLGPVPRRAPETALRLLYDLIDRPGGNKVVFRGWTVAGSPRYAGELGRLATDLGLIFGAIENRTQSGLDAVLSGAGYRGFRVRQITPDDRPGSFALAVRERHIRMLLVEPALGSRSADVAVSAWLGVIARARSELAEHGLGPSVTAGFPGYRVPLWAVVMAGLGVGSGAWLCAGAMLGDRRVPPWPGLLLAVVMGAAVSLGYGWREAAALLGGVSFGSLGVITVVRSDRPIRPGWAVVGVFLSAVAGGLLLTVLLGDAAWALTIRQFRGVKLLYAVPPLLAGAAWIVRETARVGGWGFAVRRVLASPVRGWYLALAGLILAFAVVYVGRSGHTAGLPVWSVEAALRALFESELGIRPRTKEFLFGYPALVLMNSVGGRWAIGKWLLALAAIVAPVSVVNSFAHLHTPVLQTALRSLLGAGLGLGVGIVVLWGYRLLVDQAGRSRP